jgi:uncharacterized membrane protein
MTFFAMMFLIFVFMRFGRFHRMRRWHRGYAFGCHPYRQLHPLRYEPEVRPPAPRETAFETLKRKYVKGELSDDQYEAQLDQLLSTPEGRREIQ